MKLAWFLTFEMQFSEQFNLQISVLGRCQGSAGCAYRTGGNSHENDHVFQGNLVRPSMYDAQTESDSE